RTSATAADSAASSWAADGGWAAGWAGAGTGLCLPPSDQGSFQDMLAVIGAILFIIAAVLVKAASGSAWILILALVGAACYGFHLAGFLPWTYTRRVPPA